MRNKKSVLMTLNHNYGYFSGVGGIAGNVSQLQEVANFVTGYFLLLVNSPAKRERDVTNKFCHFL